MKVHRIITTIEVENDDYSMTTVEITKLNLDNINPPTAITNLTTNGSANNINQVYCSIKDIRYDISQSLKGIVNLINSNLNNINFDTD